MSSNGDDSELKINETPASANSTSESNGENANANLSKMFVNNNGTSEKNGENANANNNATSESNGENANANNNATSENNGENENTPKQEEYESKQPSQTMEDEDEDEVNFFIGDRIGINSKKYGKLIIGRIYYFADDLIRIIPDESSDTLYDFPIINGAFDPDLEVIPVDNDGTMIAFYEEGGRVGFVEFRGFRTGQILEAIDKNKVTIGTYEIISISYFGTCILSCNDTIANLSIN